MRTYHVYSPLGTLLAKRRTTRTYSHAVVFISATGRVRAMAYCGSQSLAATQLRYWLSHVKYRFAPIDLESFELHIFPVSEVK